MSLIIKLLHYLWASPNTVVGLTVGLFGLLTGGKMQVIRGAVEFHGGGVRWLLRHSFLGESTMAMTVGHTILGQTESSLAISRDHEHVHVRQYEIWGPFFVPAYGLSSLYLCCVKRDPYRDNPFEVEAYSLADPSNLEEMNDELDSGNSDDSQ